MTEILDHLKISQDEKFLSRHQIPSESVRFSASLLKINEKGSRQNRILIITIFGVYNFKRDTLKRSVPIERLIGVAMSHTEGHFVLQFDMTENCDYYYVGSANEVVKCLKFLKSRLIVVKAEVDSMERFRRRKNAKKNVNFIPVTAGIRKKATNSEENHSGVLVFSMSSGVEARDLLSYSEVSRTSPESLLKIVKLHRFPGFWWVRIVPTAEESVENVLKTYSKSPEFGSICYIVSSYSGYFLYSEYQQISELLLKSRSLGGVSKLEFVRKVAYDLSLALDSLHKTGYVYGKLIPSNIVFTPQSDDKLVQFRSKSYENDPLSINLTVERRIIPYAEYMSPEYIFENRYGQGSDWWSLGVILWEMLTGSNPFLSAVDLSEAILKAEGTSVDPQYRKAAEFVKILMPNAPTKFAFGGATVLQHSFFFEFTSESTIQSERR